LVIEKVWTNRVLTGISPKLTVVGLMAQAKRPPVIRTLRGCSPMVVCRVTMPSWGESDRGTAPSLMADCDFALMM
jgi:hypothetical protein